MMELIISPIEKVMKEEKIVGEKLVNSGRLVVVLLLYPLILVRMYYHDISGNYLILSVFQWMLLIFYTAVIYSVIKKRKYVKYLGYVTIFTDLLFLSTATFFLSLFTPIHNGLLNEPIWEIICYIICYSSALRFEYRYSVFCIFTCTILILLQLLA